MIIPWKVDVPQERLPFANWLLIAIIIGVFAWQVPQARKYAETIQKKLTELQVSAQKDPNNIKAELKKIKNPFEEYLLTGWTNKGMFTHMWLHGGLLHLIGNLLFLWIFGNAVCAKIGNIIYAPIYIITGLSAAITYLLFSNHPMLGASGAINGIVGMYLVFFPVNSITCYWSLTLLYWKEFEAPSYTMILLWLVYDIFGAAIGGSNVAYFAHFGGFATGFVIAIILLKTKLITMTKYEKSLLEVFSKTGEKTPPSEPRLDRNLLMRNPNLYEQTAADANPTSVSAETKQIPQPALSADDFFRQPTPQTEPLPTQSKAPTGDSFIRFYCTCGKRIKVAAQYAGKTGKCPQCKQPVKIPKISG